MSARLGELLAVPEEREAGLRTVLERLAGAQRVVLTTHVNADADGAGSEAAVAAWLETAGKRATIVNPTPFPSAFRFLLHRPDVICDWGREGAEEALREADLVLVLDTSEANRVAPLAHLLDPARTVVVDHHPAGPTVVGSTTLQDPSAAATGELVHDLLNLAGAEWTEPCVVGVYVALVSDTGSFRFSNTTPRTHAIAAELLSRGADPEAVYQHLFATFPRRRFELLREALANLHSEPELGLSWIVIRRDVVERVRAASDDFEGLIDHARSLEGTEVALLFRETPDGQTKLSLRSNGAVDVNRIARRFGGGGHVKASGATLTGPPDQSAPPVLEAAREALREALGEQG